MDSAYDRYNGVRDSIESDLINHSEIPSTVVTDNTIKIRHHTNGTYVFDYPTKPFFETGEAYVPYVDVVESVVSEYVDVRRKAVTHKTDGRPDRHYWIIRGDTERVEQ